MNEYEIRVMDGLRAEFGTHWYMHGAHPSTIMDYMQARDEAGRQRAIETMQRDAITYATRVGHALVNVGIVTFNR